MSSSWTQNKSLKYSAAYFFLWHGALREAACRCDGQPKIYCSEWCTFYAFKIISVFVFSFRFYCFIIINRARIRNNHIFGINHFLCSVVYCFVIIFLNRNISSSSLQFSSMSSGTAGPR